MPNGKWTKRTSDTETGVLELLREGKSISVVAKDMGLHPSSVKRLRKKLQQKGLLELNEKTK
jgi:DNA-binding IclR family transcriptional regulator